MKNISLTLSFVLYSLLAIAQDDPHLTIEASQELKSSPTQELYDIIPCKEGCFYSLKYDALNGKNVKLYHYENDFVLTDVTRLKLRRKNYKLKFDAFFSMDHKPYYVCSQLEKGGNQRRYFVSSINKKNKAPFEFTINTEEGMENQIDYRLSPDKSKIMLIASQPSGGLKSYIFDRHLQLLSEEDIFMAGYHHIYEQINLDNSGNSYFLVAKNTPTGKSYSLLTNINGTLRRIDKPKCLEGKILLNMLMTQVPSSKEIICAGYYSDPLQDFKKGIYHFSIKNKKLDCAESHLFGEEVINDKFEKKLVWNQLELSELILKKDGTMLLIAEEYFEESQYVGNLIDTKNMKDDYYGSGDLLITSLKRSGEIQWSKRINKSQFSVNDYGYYNSYTSAIFNENLYLFYNEQEVKKSHKLQNSFPLVYLVLDKKGNMLRKQNVFNSNSLGGILAQPQTARQTENGEILLFGQKRSKDQFFKFSAHKK